MKLKIAFFKSRSVQNYRTGKRYELQQQIIIEIVFYNNILRFLDSSSAPVDIFIEKERP